VVLTDAAYYKNREGNLLDTSDNMVGFCFPSAMKGTDFDCGMTDYPDERHLGSILLWCDISVW
jgi:hypothetical protein